MEHAVSVRNLPAKQVGLWMERLRDWSGNKQTTMRKPRVYSKNPSVRGIWNPFISPHKI